MDRLPRDSSPVSVEWEAALLTLLPDYLLPMNEKYKCFQNQDSCNLQNLVIYNTLMMLVMSCARLLSSISVYMKSLKRPECVTRIERGR